MAENYVLYQPFQARNSENSLIAIQSSAINTDSNQPEEATNSEHTLLVTQPSGTRTDYNAQQNVTTEIQIDNEAGGSFNLMVLAKFENLQGNNKTFFFLLAVLNYFIFFYNVCSLNHRPRQVLLQTTNIFFLK